ncbi:DIP1984 family protein [Paenibacillus urinalis]|uniref:DIP1984 family protein n=1 Tax=Paenibacillus urinalis TaxID=521520 RepID=UPI001960F4A7
MKLAEALILRSDIQTKIQQLRFRLEGVVRVQEGEPPVEDPAELFAELEESLSQYTKLVQDINRTNSQTLLDTGISIADALALRENYVKHRDVLYDVIRQATIRLERTSRSEIKFVTTVDHKKLQKQVDELAKAHRVLDTKIQEKNWTTELITTA